MCSQKTGGFRNKIFCREVATVLRAMLRDSTARKWAVRLLAELWDSGALSSSNYSNTLSLHVEELCGKVFTWETISILFDLHNKDPTTVPDLSFFFEEASGGGGEYVKFMPVASTQIAVGGAHKVAFDIRDSLRDGWTDAG